MDFQNDSEQNEFQEKSQRHPKFYFALLVCLAAVSVAGWSTYKTVKEFIAPQQKISSPRISRPKEKNSLKKTGKSVAAESGMLNGDDEAENGKKKGDAIPYGKKTTETKQAPDSESSKNQAVTDGEEEAKPVWAEKTAESPETSYPTEGNRVVKEFSGETPVYSQTFCDWRVHEGTDFKAEKDSPVKAIANGVVADVYDDSSYGKTIVVSHDGGFTAYYSGLSEKLLSKKGDKIKSGQQIGTLGEIPCESLEEPHLHLAINKDGKFIDPLLILEKENQ